MATLTEAAAYLDSQFKFLAQEVNQPLHDEQPDGYGRDMELAANKMSKTSTDVPGLDVEQYNIFLMLAEYFALRRFARLLATRVDTGSYAVEGDREEIFKNVLRLLQEVEAHLLQLGFNLGVGVAGSAAAAIPGTHGAWQLLQLDLNYLTSD